MSGRFVYWLKRVVVVLLFIAGIGGSLPPGAEGMRGSTLQIGDSPPKIVLSDVQGRPVALFDEMRGKVVVLHFWASCKQCLEEVPLLNSFYRSHKDKGLVILAVNVGQSKEWIEKFLREVKVSYPVLLDANMKAARSYGVRAVPQTFIIDRKGLIRYKILGGVTEKTLKRSVLGLL
ncbi:MAG: TlpA disulfide reductase family protein [Nitrospirota bacterium]